MTTDPSLTLVDPGPVITPAPMMVALPADLPPMPAPVLSAGTLESILAADDLGRDVVDMPEWNCTVTIRGLSYAEWDDIRQKATVNDTVDSDILTRMLLSASLVEPAVSSDQAFLLMGKSMAAVERLNRRIVALSHIGEDSITEAEATFPG